MDEKEKAELACSNYVKIYNAYNDDGLVGLLENPDELQICKGQIIVALAYLRVLVERENLYEDKVNLFSCGNVLARLDFLINHKRKETKDELCQYMDDLGDIFSGRITDEDV